MRIQSISKLTAVATLNVFNWFFYFWEQVQVIK